MDIAAARTLAERVRSEEMPPHVTEVAEVLLDALDRVANMEIVIRKWRDITGSGSPAEFRMRMARLEAMGMPKFDLTDLPTPGVVKVDGEVARGMVDAIERGEEG